MNEVMQFHLVSFPASVVTTEERTRIQLRNDDLCDKRSKILAHCREQERTTEMPNGPKVGDDKYGHVSSRLFDQTEAQIQRLRALDSDEADIDSKTKYGAVAGNFADQIGIQRRAVLIPVWRQKLCG